MPPTPTNESLSLVPIEATRTAAGHSSAGTRLGAARAVFDSASRLAQHALSAGATHDGPGWFDSSLELRSGCEVREGWPADASLREWVEGWLLHPAGGGLSSLRAT
jgi:hypothetical protein